MPIRHAHCVAWHPGALRRERGGRCSMAMVFPFPTRALAVRDVETVNSGTPRRRSPPGTGLCMAFRQREDRETDGPPRHFWNAQKNVKSFYSNTSVTLNGKSERALTQACRCQQSRANTIQRPTPTRASLFCGSWYLSCFLCPFPPSGWCSGIPGLTVFPHFHRAVSTFLPVGKKGCGL